tara:strand:- start:1025 stop:2143 length:1119 start_codon:yes stop_codon:yes gene_type:complete
MKFYIKSIPFYLLTLLLMACGNSENNVKKKAESSKPTYQVTSIKSDTLEYELSLPGELKPYEEVTLYAKIEGFVEKLSVDRGDMVTKGELLLSIEAPEIQQQLLAARAKQREIAEKLSFSGQNFQRMNRASEVEGAISSIELEQTKTRFMGDSAALSAVKAEVAAAAQLAGYRNIKAPFDGVVTSRLVSPGALVGSGKEPLLKLAREDKLRLVVAIPSKHADALSANTKANFTVNGAPGKEFPVSFSRSSRALDPELRSLMVEFDYDNSANILSAGAYAQVHLNLKRNQPTLKVPASSIITTTTQTLIAKVKSGKIQMVPITTGISKDGMIEIFGNVDSGDQIIIKGNSTLKNGMSINTVNTKNIQINKELP